MFTSSHEMSPRIKVLYLGPSGVGKTLPGLQMPGPLAVMDGEDGVRAYKNDFEFGSTPFFHVDDLNEKLAKIRKDSRLLASFTSLLIDGATTAWHGALADVTNDAGKISMSDQAKLKAGFKELNDHIFALGKLDKNVVVTAQSKNDWEILPGKAPVLKGSKADIDDRLWFAFDLVIAFEKTGANTRDGVVLKSRYHRILPIGTRLKDFSYERHIAPLLSSNPVKSAEGRSSVEDLRERVRGLATTLKGAGVLPSALGTRVRAATTAAPLSAEMLGEVLTELEQIEIPAAAGAA